VKESVPKAQTSLRDYLFIVFHRKKVFLLPALIIFFTVSIGSFFLPKYYSSAVLLLIQDEDTINPLTPRTDMTAHLPVSLREQLTTLTEKILNYPQISAVISKLGLLKESGNLQDREELFYSIRRRTKVRLRSAEVVEIVYEDKDPKMAEKFVNALVNSFIEYSLNQKKQKALIGVNFAESQAKIYRKKLEEAEDKLAEFRKKFPLQTPGKDTDINVSLLINYQTQLTNEKLLLDEYKQKEMKLKNQLSGKEPIELTSEMLTANSIVSSLADDLRRTQLRLDDLRHSNPASEDIPKLELDMDDLRRRLTEETEKEIDAQTPFTSPFLYNQLKQQINEIEENIKTLMKRKTDLEKLVADLEERINSLPEQQRMHARLLRDSEVNRNIYEMLLLKLEENRLDAVEAQQKGLRYEILEKGRLPLKPSKPQKLFISIVALIAGIISGLGAVFLMEIADHSFRGVEDARRYLDIPVIGSTMKIMTRPEINMYRRRQTAFTITLSFIFILFIIIAVITSSVQEKKLTQQILREQLMEE